MAAICQIANLAPDARLFELQHFGLVLLGASGRFVLVWRRDETILAWRETFNEADWRLNFSAVPVPLPRVPGVKMHRLPLAFEAD